MSKLSVSSAEEYMKCKKEDTKDIMKIRLHMWKVKDESQKRCNDIIKCPLCSKHDGTTEHVMVCRRENDGKQYQVTEETTEEECLGYKQ